MKPSNDDLELLKKLNENNLVCPERKNPGDNVQEVAQSAKETLTEKVSGRKKRQVMQNGSQMGSNGEVPPQQGGAVPDYLTTEYRFIGQYMNVSEEERKKIGHQFSDLIKSCTFRGRDCLKEKYFENLTSSTFGNCFSFNSNISGTSHAHWASSLPGPSQGLIVVLNLEQQNYMANGLTASAGARQVLLAYHMYLVLQFKPRVTIDTTQNRPLVDEFGLDVPPATFTSFAIKQV